MTEFICFENKVALITGAGGALGSVTALDFSTSKALLSMIDINKERLDYLVEALKKKGHPEEKLVAYHGDVNNPDHVQKLVKTTTEKFGRLDYVINIVGGKRMGNIETCSLEDLDECLTMSVRTTFIVSKMTIPHLIQSKGCIVNMSSVSGIRPYHAALPYGTSKAALNQMTQIMAAHLAKKGVRVNCVCPATCYSQFNITSGQITSKEQLDKYLSTSSRAIPMGRVGKVEEVTRTILFLCSDTASFITGANLPIDGAYTQTLYESPM